MPFTARELLAGLVALLAFPLLINLTGLAADGEGRSVDDPLFRRGDTPARTAGR